jgi:hypothetical protein
MSAGTGGDDIKLKKAKLTVTLEGLCDSVSELLSAKVPRVNVLPCDDNLTADSKAFIESCVQLSGHINKMLESLDRAAAGTLQDLRNISNFLQGSGEVMKMRVAVQELMKSVPRHLTVQPPQDTSHVNVKLGWNKTSRSSRVLMSTGTCLALLHSALKRDHSHMDGVSLEVYPDDTDVSNCYVVRCEGARPTFDKYKDATAYDALRMLSVELGLDYGTCCRRLRLQVPGSGQEWSDFVATVIKIIDTEKRRQFAQLADIFSETPVDCPWDVASITSAMSLPVIVWLTRREVQPKVKPAEPPQKGKGSKGKGSPPEPPQKGKGSKGKGQGTGSSKGSRGGWAAGWAAGSQGSHSWQPEVPPLYQPWAAAWGPHCWW